MSMNNKLIINKLERENYPCLSAAKLLQIPFAAAFFYLYIPHIAVSETPVQRSFNIESILKER